MNDKKEQIMEMRGQLKAATFQRMYGTSRTELIYRTSSQDRNRRMEMNIASHMKPDQGDIERNQYIEPEGERLRRELIEWLRANKIVSLYLDTPEHCVDIQIVRLPPNIKKVKKVLSSRGSIYVKDEPVTVTFSEDEGSKPTRKFRAAQS